MLRIVKNKPHQLLAWALLAAILCFYIVAAIRFPMVYIWATYEDLFGEWLQVWCFVVALIAAVRLSMTRWRYRWFFVLLAVSCFYVAMEEISWGQRVFGFSSPRLFKANNLQGETNLHNFLTGPYRTSLKTVLTYLLAGALAGYGLVYPALLRLRFRVAVWLDARGLAAPPLYLWPFFVVAAILECGGFRFNEAEVAEIVVGLGLALMTVQYRFTQRRRLDVHRTKAWPGEASEQLALRLGEAAAFALALAVGTTMAVYMSSEGKARIDKRIDNGIEKFAGRYTRYEQWDIAADLYQRMHAKEPRNASILRKLADCYRQMGDQERFVHYIKKVLTMDLKRYQEDPGRASVNRSLVRTYRMIGEEAKANKHLQEALSIGLERIEEHPTSASAAYSLGKTYSLMEQRQAALEQLSRAYKLKPTSKKYRKSYYSARNKVP